VESSFSNSLQNERAAAPPGLPRTFLKKSATFGEPDAFPSKELEPRLRNARAELNASPS
jgi:hypothetical protein